MALKTLKTVLAAAGVLAVAGTMSAADAEDKLKVGFVYVGPVGDHGWTWSHDQGRKAIEAAFPDEVETSFVESVKEGADAERVIRRLASTGHDLIFTTSFGYMNPTLKVAQRFPDVKFEHATGYKRADNVSTYSGRFYEGRYVAGVVAGKTTESNILGYVASFPIPEVIRGINSFILGARSVNPDAEVRVVWVNSWFDPPKEGAAANALIDQGADVITQHTDSPAPLQAAAAKGIKAFGQASDMIRFAPETQMTAIIDYWNSYYIARTKAVLDGTWSSEDTWGGFDSYITKMAPFTNVPGDVAALGEETYQKIINGEFHPFTGPIKNQAGETIVAAGEVMSDKDLVGMNWYVEGVIGSVPN